MPLKLILDCDPGLDDALALLLAHGDPNIELVAVTTVGGNVGVEKTTRNALELRDYLGFPDVPVAAGAGEPLRGSVKNAEHVHGDSGLGNVRLPAATGTASESTRSTCSSNCWARRRATSIWSRPVPSPTSRSRSGRSRGSSTRSRRSR